MVESVKEQVKLATEELLEVAELEENALFVVGMSTSEILGGRIGKASSQELGDAVIGTILNLLKEKKINLAVQGCEHLNRACVVERRVALERGFEIVDVLPQLHAGGAGSVAAFQLLDDPVEVEFISAEAGLDIGDTFIGMHIKHVCVPVRLSLNQIGQAHLTAARRRPKKIGGERAKYQ